MVKLLRLELLMWFRVHVFDLIFHWLSPKLHTNMTEWLFNEWVKPMRDLQVK